MQCPLACKPEKYYFINEDPELGCSNDTYPIGVNAIAYRVPIAIVHYGNTLVFGNDEVVCCFACMCAVAHKRHGINIRPFLRAYLIQEIKSSNEFMTSDDIRKFLGTFNIPTAPTVYGRFGLRKFGGHFTIDEYRMMCRRTYYPHLIKTIHRYNEVPNIIHENKEN
jgi:hypothetical protein